MSYRCCNVGSMNVDIDAETSKLHAKEEKNSMSGRLIGITQPKIQVDFLHSIIKGFLFNGIAWLLYNKKFVMITSA